MSIFNDNIKTATPTETILRYACEEFKSIHPKLREAGIWSSWTNLYNALINVPPYGRSSIADFFISRGRDRYYGETGKFMDRQFIMWPRDSYMSGKVKDLIFVEVEKTSWSHAEGAGTFAYGFNSHTEGQETVAYGCI